LHGPLAFWSHINIAIEGKVNKNVLLVVCIFPGEVCVVLERQKKDNPSKKPYWQGTNRYLSRMVERSRDQAESNHQRSTTRTAPTTEGIRVFDHTPAPRANDQKVSQIAISWCLS
jgi:hypothetical protein